MTNINLNKLQINNITKYGDLQKKPPQQDLVNQWHDKSLLQTDKYKYLISKLGQCHWWHKTPY